MSERFASIVTPIAAITGLLTAALCATPAHAQSFSPYLEMTGKGAYDQYRDAVLCSAVFEQAIETMPNGAQRPQLEEGLDYSVNFAHFLLESGNVADTTGAILTAENLPAARRDARAVWRAVLVSLGEVGETPDAEIARCLLLYGHEW